MKNLLTLVRRPFRRSYRLTFHLVGHDRPANVYSPSRRLIRGQIRRLDNFYYWALYRTGPFNAPERLIRSADSSARPSLKHSK